MATGLHQEPAIVRIWRKRPQKGEAIILFPEWCDDFQGRLVKSWMEVGQHGEADYAVVMHGTRPATPAEAEAAKNLYERTYGTLDEPVVLKLCRRRTPQHRKSYDQMYLDILGVL